MFESAKTEQVIKEKNSNLSVLSSVWVSEDGLDLGVRQHNGSIILFSGKDNAHFKRQKQPNLKLIRARFASRYCNVTTLQFDPHTNEHEEEDKDDFYEQLRNAVSATWQAADPWGFECLSWR